MNGGVPRTKMNTALFPSLLGPAFERLDQSVRDAHDGRSVELVGTARVTRGRSLAARLVCTLLSLPGSAARTPLTVHIAVSGARERWTRQFASSRPMGSTLRAKAGTLEERLGPATLAFRLSERDTAMEWALQRVTFLGVPLRRDWFKVSAWSGGRGGNYSFHVATAVRGLGRIIDYAGDLAIREPTAFRAVVFDGHCYVCSGWARFHHRHPANPPFQLIAMQTDLGRALLSRYRIDPNDPSTFWVLDVA